MKKARQAELLDYLTDEGGFELEQGYLKIPQRPGLGIEINEEAVRELAIKGHDWRAPLWRHEDGSIAEW